MKRIQVNHIKVDEDILKEIKKYILPTWQKYMLSITMLIALVISSFIFMNQRYIEAIVLLVLAAVCFVEIIWLSNQRLKKILKTMIEETDKEFNIYALIFGSDALTIRNCDMKTDNKLQYEDMKRIVETENTYTVFGKKSQFAVVRKDCLKIDQKEFIDFLKSKETKIKKWPKQENDNK
ncbi:MAG: hypothetical protein RR585_14145 [Coprobacillus sp.]